MSMCCTLSHICRRLSQSSQRWSASMAHCQTAKVTVQVTVRRTGPAEKKAHPTMPATRPSVEASGTCWRLLNSEDCHFTEEPVESTRSDESNAFAILNNGQRIPLVGLGTSGGYDEEIKQAVKDAIDIGYRHIDTAHFYKNEKAVGEAVAEKIAEGKIKREDIFLTSKLWNCFHREDLVQPALERTLSDLGVKYLDLYLMHWPFSYKDGWSLEPRDENGKLIYGDSDFTDIWKAMEKCVKLGLTKSIGLSNFNRKQIQRILDIAEIKPVTNQVECHPYLVIRDHVEFCKLQGIIVTAYRPISGHSKLSKVSAINDPMITSLAKKYSKTPAQVMLKFQLQRGIVVIPKSTNKERMQANFSVFDFELTEKEIDDLMALDKGESGRTIPMEECKQHKDYPFTGEF